MLCEGLCWVLRLDLVQRVPEGYGGFWYIRWLDSPLDDGVSTDGDPLGVWYRRGSCAEHPEYASRYVLPSPAEDCGEPAHSRLICQRCDLGLSLELLGGLEDVVCLLL